MMDLQLFFALLLLPCSVASGDIRHQEELEVIKEMTCPTWYHTNSAGRCECGVRLGNQVICKPNKKVATITWLCMSYDNKSKVTVAGECIYSPLGSFNNDYFIEQPISVAELDNFTCGWLNRTGLLCSHCRNRSHGVAVLSYRYECVECLGSIYGWLLYFTLVLVPVTIFFLVIIACNIRATAAHMNAFIYIVQITLYTINSNIGGVHTNFEKLAVTLLGIWNLDFFQYTFPPFCIDKNYSTLRVLSFGYINAFYPLALLIITYICIELYDKNYRLFRAVWLPFGLCLSFIQKYSSIKLHINAKLNILNAFATFIILAYCKILYTNFALLGLTQLYESNGYSSGTQYTLYDASVLYLGEEHKFYFILAIIVLLVFNFFSMLLLLLYPTKPFQKLLNCFPRMRWDYLHIFMDCFQGCYKNGTNNTLDYRYFAGLYLLIRFIHHIGVFYGSSTITIKSILYLTLSILFGVLRPYRNDIYNRLDCMFFGLVTLGYVCVLCNEYIINLRNFSVILYFLGMIAVSYTLLILLQNLILIVCPQSLIVKLKKIL